MGMVIELDRAFRRLIFDRTYRQAFARGSAGSELSPAVYAALAAVDTRELEKLARNVLRGVASGRLGGCRLEDSFQGTLKHLVPESGDDGDTVEGVIALFLASDEFARIEAVGNAEGISVPEAFHDFAVELAAGDAYLCRIVQHECTTATLRVLAITERPPFRVQSPLVRLHANGALAILDGDRALADAQDRPERPLALVATGRRFWCGPISETLAAALLANVAAPPAWVRDLRVCRPREVAEAEALLRGRGLL